MPKAFFWSADDGGCGWYRTELTSQALSARGHEVGQSMTFDDQFADLSVPVVGQRIHQAGPTTLWTRWCNRGRRTVFDADDDYFHMDRTNHGAFEEYGRRGVRARLLGNAACASVVTVCSPLLGEIFAQYCSRVLVVPNGLPERYLSQPRPQNEKPVVGWVGTSSTLYELPIAWSAFSRTMEYGGVAQTVGVPYAVMRHEGLSAPGVRHTDWIPTRRYLDSINFDIWVAPYRRTAYNQAKAPTKALEAAFLGVPVVASGTDPYLDFVDHGVTGFIARSEQDWHEYIRMLIADPQLRQQMGDAARVKAAEYTTEKLAAVWETVLFGKLRGFTT